jgi:flagellar biosynthesis chaperone FliJ
MATNQASLAKIVDEARHTIEQLKTELTQSRGQVGNLTEQLVHSYTARNEGAEKAAR